MGEAILEATPQYCLQLYIILHTLDPTWTQWFALITSLISLSIPTIQKYHSQQKTELNFKEESPTVLVKKVSETFLLPSLVIFLNTLGKILCVTIIAVFFQFNIFAFGLYIGPLFVLLTLSGPLYSLNKEEDFNQQLLEAIFLGFISQSNLNRSRSAKVVRLVLFYFTLTYYSILMMTIMVICNVNPNFISIDNFIAIAMLRLWQDFGIRGIIWKDLILVQHLPLLNTVCGTAIGCLVISCMLDVLYQNISDDGGVYHAPWREFSNPQFEKLQKFLGDIDWLFTLFCCLFCNFFCFQMKNSDSFEVTLISNDHHNDKDVKSKTLSISIDVNSEEMSYL